MQLVFQVPSSARVGENFDVTVAIAAQQPIARIVVEVTYDPQVLRVRTKEELDTSVRTGDREFSINQSSEGQAELALQPRRRATVLEIPMTVPVVQFEAIQQGTVQLRITNINAFDPGERSIAWTASGQESEIVVN